MTCSCPSCLNLVADMAVHDNNEGTVLLIANAINANGTDENVDGAWHDAVARVRAMVEQLRKPVAQPMSVVDVPAASFAESVQERWDRNEYLGALDRSQGSHC